MNIKSFAFFVSSFTSTLCLANDENFLILDPQVVKVSSARSHLVISTGRDQVLRMEICENFSNNYRDVSDISNNLKGISTIALEKKQMIRFYPMRRNSKACYDDQKLIFANQLFESFNP